MNSILNDIALGVRFAPYVRVSTTLESQKDSLENQTSFFINYIKDKKGELFNIYSDDGKTGTSLTKRDEMKNLLKDAKKGLFDVVLIKSITRWARDTVDSITLVRDLKGSGVRVVSIEDGYDSFDDHGEMKLTLLSMMAQQESDNISKNVSFGIREKARHGIFHGTPPYGYSNEKGKLIPRYPEAQIVQEIFKLYLKNGWGMQRIANHLTENKVPTPRTVLGAKNAGSIWHQSSIKIILANVHYVGDLLQGKSKTDPSDKAFSQRHGYKKRIIMDEEEVIFVPETHSGLISREEFHEVQTRMKSRAKMRFCGRGKKSLFARIAYCADCGAGMVFKNNRNTYICGSYQKRGGKVCTSHRIKSNILKEKVLSDIRILAEESIDTNALQKVVQKQSGNKSEDLKDQLTELNKTFKQLDNEKIQLVRALTRETVDDTTFKKQQQVIDSEIKVVKEKKAEIEKSLFQQKDDEKRLISFHHEVKRFVQLKIDEDEVLRQALHSLIEKIDVAENGKIEAIHYNFKKPMGT
ncbi:serine recombinase [Thalassobacillus devorans]|uniref:Serine recombinase n=1 Tax=Thalassobacillus devorans TaxID=279813 RepID=A0ABQ1NZD7_9BACI|nr:recombinase family protein [Thalassobacillus devorans]NIK28228.1 DNA invertase Pin-like site-specific DNA recombinase [Thalassobacillus devorans]GGC87883.1 serine recombinase [Thalassobacillus devorans]